MPSGWAMNKSDECCFAKAMERPNPSKTAFPNLGAFGANVGKVSPHGPPMLTPVSPSAASFTPFVQWLGRQMSKPLASPNAEPLLVAQTRPVAHSAFESQSPHPHLQGHCTL